MEACDAVLYYVICDKHDDYLSAKCPILKLSKPNAMMLGFDVDKLGFFQVLQDDLNGVYIESPLTPLVKVPPTTLVKVKGNHLTAEIIQNELWRRIHSKWNWEAVSQGVDSYLVAFLNLNELSKMVDTEFHLKAQGLPSLLENGSHPMSRVPCSIWNRSRYIYRVFLQLFGIT